MGVAHMTKIYRKINDLEEQLIRYKDFINAQ